MILRFSKIEPLFIKELGVNYDHGLDHYYAILRIKGLPPSPSKGTFKILGKVNDIYTVSYSYAAALELELYEK